MTGKDDVHRQRLVFFHASEQRYAVDDFIRYPRREMVRSEPRRIVDRLFERGRRFSEVCRNSAVFLIGLPEDVAVSHAHFRLSGARAPKGHVFRVQPQLQPTRHDRKWVDELQARHRPSVRGAVQPSIGANPEHKGLTDAEVVESYWLGLPTPTPEWEFMTDQVRVLEHVIERVLTIFDPEAFQLGPTPKQG
jgi:hypothetical protein